MTKVIQVSDSAKFGLVEKDGIKLQFQGGQASCDGVPLKEGEIIGHHLERKETRKLIERSRQLLGRK